VLTLCLIKRTYISILEVTEQLGHPNDAVLKATAMKFNLKYDTTPMPYENCASAKIKIKNFPKEPPTFLAKEKGDRIMFDISSVNALSQGGNQVWLLIMDDYINYCWSFFLPHKDDLPQVILQWLRQVTSQYKIKVKCFQCNNAGENRSLRNGKTISNLSIQHLIHLNKMVKLNVNLLHYIARFDLSLMQLAFQPSMFQIMVLCSQVCHPIREDYC
jgi:hypothetical protein